MTKKEFQDRIVRRRTFQSIHLEPSYGYRFKSYITVKHKDLTMTWPFHSLKTDINDPQTIKTFNRYKKWAAELKPKCIDL